MVLITANVAPDEMIKSVHGRIKISFFKRMILSLTIFYNLRLISPSICPTQSDTDWTGCFTRIQRYCHIFPLLHLKWRPRRESNSPSKIWSLARRLGTFGAVILISIQRLRERLRERVNLVNSVLCAIGLSALFVQLQNALHVPGKSQRMAR